MIKPKVGDIVWFYGYYAEPDFGEEAHDCVHNEKILLIDDSGYKCLTESFRQICTRNLWASKAEIEEYNRVLTMVKIGDLVSFVVTVDDDGHDIAPFIVTGVVTAFNDENDGVIVHTPDSCYDVLSFNCLVTSCV